MLLSFLHYGEDFTLTNDPLGPKGILIQSGTWTRCLGKSPLPSPPFDEGFLGPLMHLCDYNTSCILASTAGPEKTPGFILSLPHSQHRPRALLMAVGGRLTPTS